MSNGKSRVSGEYSRYSSSYYSSCTHNGYSFVSGPKFAVSGCSGFGEDLNPSMPSEFDDMLLVVFRDVKKPQVIDSQKWDGAYPDILSVFSTPEVLVVPCRDMKPPPFGEKHWKALAKLASERTLVFSCMAGHGRTGTAMIATLAASGMDVVEATRAVRESYCTKVVETDSQRRYLARHFGSTCGDYSAVVEMIRVVGLPEKKEIGFTSGDVKTYESIADYLGPDSDGKVTEATWQICAGEKPLTIDILINKRGEEENSAYWIEDVPVSKSLYALVEDDAYEVVPAPVDFWASDKAHRDGVRKWLAELYQPCEPKKEKGGNNKKSSKRKKG